MEGKFHILVVDDEPNVLVTYRLILQQQGYDVSAALSSKEARAALAGDRADLLSSPADRFRYPMHGRKAATFTASFNPGSVRTAQNERLRVDE
jgi:hypothetical protein